MWNGEEVEKVIRSLIVRSEYEGSFILVFNNFINSCIYELLINDVGSVSRSKYLIVLVIHICIENRINSEHKPSMLNKNYF